MNKKILSNEDLYLIVGGFKVITVPEQALAGMAHSPAFVVPDQVPIGGAEYNIHSDIEFVGELPTK